jgi:hypothetical protein
VTDTRNQHISEIEPGLFNLIFDYQTDPVEPVVAFEIQFMWDGETAASFVYDAWEDTHESTFGAEVHSAPVSGWASWANGEDLLIAFTQPMIGEEGWARVDSGAPGGSLHDSDTSFSQPETWISFAQLIHAVVLDEPVHRMTRQVY